MLLAATDTVLNGVLRGTDALSRRLLNSQVHDDQFRKSFRCTHALSHDIRFTTMSYLVKSFDEMHYFGVRCF